MKINKMSTEDLRAAILLHKQNRYSKYYKDLCAELLKRIQSNYFWGLYQSVRFGIRDYNWMISNSIHLQKVHQRIANPELI